MKINVTSYEKFIEFRAAIIRGIGLAWQDADYKKRLLQNPKAALLEQFGYRFPFNLELKADDRNATWTPTLNAGWVVHRENTLELVLPPKPKSHDGVDPRQQALIEARSLAEYNASHLTFMNNLSDQA
jgi:ribosomally synthesized peptide (two-chain TOMM family)